MALEVPAASSPAVQNVMIANRSTNTGPEQVVRRMLREAGHSGYRLHWRIDDGEGRYVCRPDITYPGRRISIFVHGCFWHRCPRCALELPKTNLEYWSKKFELNVERDRRKEQKLLEMGWKVYTIWECALNRGTCKLIDVL
jgi:DNA mismatch endonuclease (patch repair protein)